MLKRSSILVIYCSLIDHPKNNGLKQQFITSGFSGLTRRFCFMWCWLAAGMAVVLWGLDRSSPGTQWLLGVPCGIWVPKGKKWMLPNQLRGKPRICTASFLSYFNGLINNRPISESVWEGSIQGHEYPDHLDIPASPGNWPQRSDLILDLLNQNCQDPAQESRF